MPPVHFLRAFLLDHHYPVAREELLGQVDDCRDDWNSGNETRKESARRKFERDKADPAWFVREMLQYGAEAEVVEPESLREAVREMAVSP